MTVRGILKHSNFNRQLLIRLEFDLDPFLKKGQECNGILHLAQTLSRQLFAWPENGFLVNLLTGFILQTTSYSYVISYRIILLDH